MKVEVKNVITELHSTRNARERSTEAMITEEALQKNAPAVFDRVCHAISKLLQLLLLLPIAAISSGFPHKYNTKNKKKKKQNIKSDKTTTKESISGNDFALGKSLL
jgi:hypothetical protein